MRFAGTMCDLLNQSSAFRKIMARIPEYLNTEYPVECSLTVGRDDTNNKDTAWRDESGEVDFTSGFNV